MLGPPGAGKGTQAAIIGRLFGLPHVSTGAELRRAAESPTELGQRVRRHMATGALVPGEIVTTVLRARLEAVDARTRGWVLDGFPRLLEQVPELDRLDPSGRIDAVVNLVASDVVSADRLLRRRRADDVAAAVESRLAEHRRSARRILVELGRRAPVIHVDAEHPIGDVTASILRGLVSRTALERVGSSRK
jgi:adenylate kinase